MPLTYDDLTHAGTCPCGGYVYEHPVRGGRIAYTHYREDDDVTMKCRGCGREVFKDQLNEEGDGCEMR
jgi:hypothetical protein